jgi:cell division protein FtsW
MTAVGWPGARRRSARGSGRRTRPVLRIGGAGTALWRSPTTSYYLVGGATLLLLGLGLVMVLSASTVFSLRDSANSDGGLTPFSNFRRQMMFAAVGLVGAFVASRLPVRWLRRLSWPAFVASLGLMLLPLVPSLQRSQGGNAGWVHVAGFTFQPSEFAKLGLALWLGAVLAAKGPLLRQWRHALMPAMVGAGAVLALVMYGHDLGTALIIAALLAGALWVAGVPASLFTAVAALGVATAAFFVVLSPNRAHRVLSFLGMGDGPVDPQGVGLQGRVALEALGSGGLSGVGLGASAEKWLYLPEAHNDFIFAIIGEELGLLGTLLVLALYALLAVGFTRIVKRHPDPFVKIATAAIGAWIIGQAFVNIGVVIGVLPVIGVTLPLFSTGGSSLIATLIALGIVVAFARTEPGAAEALAARRGTVRRSLAVLAPRLGTPVAGRGGRG